MIEHIRSDVPSLAIHRRMRGFTLTEAIIVIVITGVLASMVAVFIQKPVQGFFDTARRAALVDAADTVARRISRDLREALPNSIRINVANTALEFLHVRSAGRYREQIDPNPSTPGDPLDFTGVDTSFDVLGQPVNVQAGDSVVVYNLGITGASAYEGTTTSRRAVAAGGPFGAALTNVTIASTTAFQFASPARRFQVVDTPVTYYCSGTQMRRNSGYAINTSQVVPVAGTGALIADKIAPTGCSFSYLVGPSQRDALITIGLSLTDSGETVSLIYQVHVSNVP
jgi:MSHA biogenesis protein MshO